MDDSGMVVQDINLKWYFEPIKEHLAETLSIDNGIPDLMDSKFTEIPDPQELGPIDHRLWDWALLAVKFDNDYVQSHNVPK